MNYRSDLSFSALFMFIGAVLCFIFMKSCGDLSPAVLPHNTETILTQTKWIAGKTDTITKVVKIAIYVPGKVIPVNDPRRSWCDSVRLYCDTTVIDSMNKIVCYDSIVGKKTWSALKFFMTPHYKQITTTITDSIPYQVNIPQRSFYASGGLGIGVVNHLYVGVDYHGKKRIGGAYYYDILQQSHNIFLKVKLF